MEIVAYDFIFNKFDCFGDQYVCLFERKTGNYLVFIDEGEETIGCVFESADKDLAWKYIVEACKKSEGEAF